MSSRPKCPRAAVLIDRLAQAWVADDHARAQVEELVDEQARTTVVLCSWIDDNRFVDSTGIDN